ncbi:MAG: hypothetical protein JWM11_6182 [Planctomycetaceae bacterium]|nr:hypothetical protein [Planctomycetaceae bacterium]
MNSAIYHCSGREVVIEQRVAEFVVSGLYELPFAFFRIEVILCKEGHFHASPNVVVRNTATNCLEHICGIGATVDAAVLDAVSGFYGEIDKESMNREIDEATFAWQQPDGYYR